MYEKLMEKAMSSNRGYWVVFLGKTIGYFVIIIILIYLYKHLQISGGNFIYNEF